MKTIHVKNYTPAQPLDLIRELYTHALKDDPLFHYFLEPELIVRITSEDCLVQVRQFLREREIQFLEYGYPVDENGKWVEQPFVLEHLDLFLTIFHTHSVAALVLNEEAHWRYLERVVHTAFNPRYIFHQQEGEILLGMGKARLEVVGIEVAIYRVR